MSYINYINFGDIFVVPYPVLAEIQNEWGARALETKGLLFDRHWIRTHVTRHSIVITIPYFWRLWVLVGNLGKRDFRLQTYNNIKCKPQELSNVQKHAILGVMWLYLCQWHNSLQENLLIWFWLSRDTRQLVSRVLVQRNAVFQSFNLTPPQILSTYKYPEHVSHEKPSNFQLYWLFNRDPYYGLLLIIPI